MRFFLVVRSRLLAVEEPVHVPVDPGRFWFLGVFLPGTAHSICIRVVRLAILPDIGLFFLLTSFAPVCPEILDVFSKLCRTIPEVAQCRSDNGNFKGLDCKPHAENGEEDCREGCGYW